MPTFTPKDWVDESSPLGPVADPDIDTPLSAAALEDLETRLSDYTDAQFTLPIPYGSGDNLVSPSESALSATVPQILEVTKGTNGAPDTGDADAGTAQPLIKFQRTKAQQRSAAGGTLGRLSPVVHVIQKSTANDEMVNLAMLIEAESHSTQTTHASTGDAECLKLYSRVYSGTGVAADAIPLVATARQDATDCNCTVLELHCDKDSAAAAYNPVSAGPDAGIRITAGINDISCGVLLRKSGSDTGQFEMGFVVNGESPVSDTAFRDDGDSIYGVAISKHKEDPDSTAGAAFSAKQKAPATFGTIVDATDFPVLSNVDDLGTASFAFYGDGTVRWSDTAATPDEITLYGDPDNTQLILDAGTNRLLITVP